jgi:subtilisin family serine protease
VIVAVIDTGVQLDHPALAASFTDTGYDFIDNDANPSDLFNNIDDDGDGLIDEGSGHGTHVSGIIHLVAPEAKIMPLRALDTEGNGEFFAVAEAIQYAVAHGANVINLSLGTPTRSDLLRDVIREATRAGVIVVAAAGNVNSSLAQYPGADQCTIGVTSVGSNSVKSSFASYGGWVDIAAPGESVYSAYPPSGYAWWSGTSMATPFVAGQAALIHSLRPDLNARDTIMLIGETAGSLNKANPKLADQLGGGRADIGASLAAVASGDLPVAGGYMSSSCIESDTA